MTRTIAIAASLLLVGRATAAEHGNPLAVPNVLFIAIDDLNDWIGPLAGHPQVKTPYIDRLARRGVVFTNAHCAAPICNPSRAAVFSGRYPFETGIYSNGGSNSNVRTVVRDSALLPRHFSKAGYRTFGTGKLLHKGSKGLFDEEYFPHQRWSPFDKNQVAYTKAELPSKKTDNPRHIIDMHGKQVVLPLNRMPSDRRPSLPDGDSFDWGPLDVDDEEMGDGKVATWAAERLNSNYEKPFFLAVGFYRPHIPLFAPKKYFDLYEDIEIALPKVKDDDLDDLPQVARELALEANTGGYHATVVRYKQWEEAVKGYLASISFVDAQIGRLLEALDSGPHGSNTIVVLWSDHGWHLGEKQHWGKWTGWQRSTRVPLIVVPMTNAKQFDDSRGKRCDETVSLVDMYPTLVELCQLPPHKSLSGQSLLPLLTDPRRETTRFVLTSFGEGNFSATSKRWHYIRYADGGAELYDVIADPNEWTNIVKRPEHKRLISKIESQLPEKLRDSSQPAAK